MLTERALASAAALLLTLSACSDRGTPAADPSDTDTAEDDPARNVEGRLYERKLVFTTLDPDSAVIVPIFFSARTLPDGVERRVRGWLTRGDEWERFFADRWRDPASRAPWRILPRGPLRLVVGEGDGLESLHFEEGPRSLTLETGPGLVEWAGAEGDAFLLHEATVRIGGRERSGLLLDASRARRSGEPDPGDWTFLVSGDSLSVLLERPAEGQPGESGAFVGFGRLDFRDLRWTEVTVAWTGSRAYEPARRDIPVSWEVSSARAEIGGSLEARAADLDAGDAEGPVLPVEALYVVDGELRVEGRAYPVTGLFRHRRQ